MELDEHFSMEGLSEEIGNIFFESNLIAIQCVYILLKENIILFPNNGFFFIIVLLGIQILTSFFLYSHMNNIRLYTFRDLIKCRYNPPLRKVYTLPKKEFYIYYHNNRYSYTRVNPI